MEIIQEHYDLVEDLKSHLYPWRKFVIGVDGKDGVGKSVLARYLAWELDLPVIETDMLIVEELKPPSYRYDDLNRLIEARHKLGRPIIVEGVFLLHTLHKISVECDYLIYVENEEDATSEYFAKQLKDYEKIYLPKYKAKFNFVWRIDR